MITPLPEVVSSETQQFLVHIFAAVNFLQLFVCLFVFEQNVLLIDLCQKQSKSLGAGL